MALARQVLSRTLPGRTYQALAGVRPQETQIAKLLGLAQDERVIMLIAFGWPDPDGQVPYSAKRGRDELRTYNSLATQTSIQ